MKIRSVTTKHVRFDMSGNRRNARRRWNAKDILVVFVEAADGTVGVGEGWTSYGSPAALAATIDDDLAPLIVGRSVYDMPAFIEACRQSIYLDSRLGIVGCGASAIEMALWDLAGKLCGRSVSSLLGVARSEVPAYASAGLYGDGKSLDDLGQEMAGYVAEGFTTVKMKVGGAPLADDVLRIAAVREAIGPSSGLLLDAHYALDVAGALRLARAAEPYAVGWLEAPLPPLQYDSYRRLSAASPIPLAGSETLPWIESFSRYISDQSVDYVMFDLSTCGGLLEGRQIADAARLNGLAATLHASSSVVLMAANVQFAGSVGNCHSIEYHMMHRWLFEHAPEDLFQVHDGMVRVSEAPGLGVDLDPAKLELLSQRT